MSDDLVSERVRAAIKSQQATSTGFRHEMADIAAQIGTPEQKERVAEALSTGLAAEVQWWAPFIEAADEIDRLRAVLSSLCDATAGLEGWEGCDRIPFDDEPWEPCEECQGCATTRTLAARTAAVSVLQGDQEPK